MLSAHPGCQSRSDSSAPCAEILATANGGKTWALQMDAEAPLSGLDFLDPQHGWAYSAHDLYITTNGGSKWSLLWHSLSPQGSYQFVTPQIGWAMGGACPGPNLPCRNLLLETQDGGALWTPNTPDGLVPSSFFFLTPSIGWLAGYPPHSQQSGQPWSLQILETRNGGKTWTRLTEVAKTGGQPGAIQSWVSPSEGWMLVNDSSACSMGGCWGSLLHTTDGGRTWHQQQAINNWQFSTAGIPGAEAFGQAGFPAGLHFVDPKTGWLSVERGAGGVGLGGVARTQDGGRTWLSLQQGSDISIRSMSVLTASEAWFVGADELTGGNPSYLLHTQDGGGTWTKIASHQVLGGSGQ